MRQSRLRTVLISGAGIAGPTLAYWLLRRGFEPTIVERAPAPRTEGYMIDFWGAGYDVAERMELLPQFLRDGYRIREVRLVNAAGERVADFDAGVLRAVSGGRLLSLLRGDLASRLYWLVADRVETLFGDTIASIEQDAEGVTRLGVGVRNLMTRLMNLPAAARLVLAPVLEDRLRLPQELPANDLASRIGPAVR